MSELHRRLLRDLPERRAPEIVRFATEPRALRSWVATLPLANFSASARMLVDGLRALNGTRLGAPERLEALEILRGPVVELATLVDKQIVGSSFPLPPQRVELGVLALAFQHELALGYQATLHDFCAPSGRVPMLKSKPVALAAVRALVHAGARLHKSYLLYRTPPTGSWRMLHDVYRFTVALGLQERTSDDRVMGAPINPRSAYAHAILLALANPYRYTQRELLSVIPLTGTLAAFCGVSNRAGTSPIAIDVDEDQSPGYLPEERTHADDATLWLDLAPALAYVDVQVSMLPPGSRLATFRQRGGPAVQVDIDLVQRLVEGWGASGARSGNRLPAGYTLQTVIGLNDTHFVLAGNTSFEAFSRVRGGHTISLSEADTRAAWTMTGESASVPRLQARIADQSSGGYRLHWQRHVGENVRAKIGEVVGLSLLNDDDALPDWMVGVIRWMRVDDEGSIDAGIGLLARRGMAVSVASRDGQGELHSDVRGILLPADVSDSKVSSVLTPGLFDQNAAELVIQQPRDPHRWDAPVRTEHVRDADLVESTGSYLRFALPEPVAEDAAGVSG